MISGLMVVAIDIVMRKCNTDYKKKYSIKRER